MSEWDLVVEGGSLVLPDLGQVAADVAIADGRIATIGRGLGRARERIDAAGRVVLPGLVDPHVHLGLERTFAEDALTETASALVGGVTTVGLFLRSLEEPYSGVLGDIRRDYEENTQADAFFHVQLFTERQIAELPRLAEFGVTSFKFYMHGLPGQIPSIDDGLLLHGFRAVAALGPDTIACVHAENDDMVMRATAALQRDKPDGTLADWADSHPDVAEAEAIHRAAYLARIAGCRLYVVHLSTEQGLREARSVRGQRRADVFFETTSPLLSVSKEDEIGLLGKMSPPLRARSDIDALWAGVRRYDIDTVGTDNTSRSRATKRPDAGLHGSRTGYPALGTHLPVLLEEGYHRRGIPLERIAQLACAAPAKIYGLYPRKGAIAIGADADLVVVDLEAERVVDPGDLRSFSDFSILEGKTLRGWPRTVVKGGAVAMHDGEILLEPGAGRYLPRGRADAGAETGLRWTV